MTRYDVFNGDADGICALQQLRLANAVTSVLVTGIKRDISLLSKVHAEKGDEITVLDISYQKNRLAVERNLELGACIRYFDHHNPGPDTIVDHPSLKTFIDTSAGTCTSLIVDQYLQNRYSLWAVVGAFGDNLEDSARRKLAFLAVDHHQIEKLRNLGIYLNYNGYGASIEDLHYPPDTLFRSLQDYSNPLEFIQEMTIYTELEEGYRADMAQAAGIVAEVANETSALYRLPEAAWARRVSGVMANRLARHYPNRAHALVTECLGGGYLVSVRAPLNYKTGADELCGTFESGGGRKGAAGINHLPEDRYKEFLHRFQKQFKR